MTKEQISFDDFKQLDLCVARILAADRIEGSDKLVRIEIDAGEGTRTLVAGIGKAYDPALLLGREIVVLLNLEPRTLMGVESNGMLLAADDNGPVLLAPDRDVPAGAHIR